MKEAEFKTAVHMQCLLGKTIRSVDLMQRQGYDDRGFLVINFTDESSVLISSAFEEGNWTGNSLGEYPTKIDVEFEPNLRDFHVQF